MKRCKAMLAAVLVTAAAVSAPFTGVSAADSYDMHYD